MEAGPLPPEISRRLLEDTEPRVTPPSVFVSCPPFVTIRLYPLPLTTTPVVATPPIRVMLEAKPVAEKLALLLLVQTARGEIPFTVHPVDVVLHVPLPC